MHNLLRKRLAGSVAFAALVASAATAQAADVTVSDAAIAGGKLEISGTASPNTWVRLDGQAGSSFNVKAGADGAFSLSVVYHPGDCIVDLQKVVSPTTVGAATEALVANCGPAGLTPRGAWSAQAAYGTNDLVTSEGSTYRAKRNNAGRQPAAGAYWEVFAAKGDSADGADGGAGRDGGEGTLAPPTGPAGGALAGTYPNPSLANNAVTSNKIANGAVIGSKIAIGAVSAPRIALGAITTPKITNNAVRSDKILDNSIVSVDVADESLTAADLGPDSVGASEIQTDAVQATEIQDNAIDSGEIVDNSLFAADLGASSVRGSELGTIIKRSVVSAAIAPGATGSALSTCLAGERVITGGNDGSLSSDVVASRDESNGWRVFIRNNGGGNTTVTVHAYCLQAS